jgi:hypothetical protein
MTHRLPPRCRGAAKALIVLTAAGLLLSGCYAHRPYHGGTYYAAPGYGHGYHHEKRKHHGHHRNGRGHGGGRGGWR